MPIPQISPGELAELLKSDAPPLLLDVRTRGEHAIVALPNSTLIPLQELHERTDEVDALKGKKVVVYCHHGVRSLNGAAFLQSRGIEASSLAGGIDLYARQVDPKLPLY